MDSPVRIEPTVAGALLEALHAHGAREIFGIPGDFALPFFDAVERMPLLALYTLSNEPSFGFAAEAAKSRRSFQLIDVRIARDALSPSLRRFAAAIS